jgi:hypothetical protein
LKVGAGKRESGSMKTTGNQSAYFSFLLLIAAFSVGKGSSNNLDRERTGARRLDLQAEKQTKERKQP